MKNILITTTLLLLLFVIAASAHDMFLKFDSYFLAPDSQAVVRLLNGEFNKSENVITRDRMRDVSLLGPAGLSHPPDIPLRTQCIIFENITIKSRETPCENFKPAAVGGCD